MFRGEDRLVVVRVYAGVAVTSLCKVDIPSSRQDVGLGTQAPRTEANNHVEYIEILRPTSLPPGKEFGRGEVL